MSQRDVVIAGMARTPMGDFLGDLSTLTATQLGAAAIKGAVARATLVAEQIDAVNMGCVLPAGLGQAPARQAAIAAGLPVSVNCITLNKMCGSGLQAAILAHDAIQVGTHDIMVAGGMESMSNAPHLIPRGRQGYRLGHGQLLDHMYCDGLEDVYEGKLMGVYAEATAKKYGYSREQQDAYALQSLSRARTASEDGSFADEIVPVNVPAKGKEMLTVSVDQHPFAVKPEKVSLLRPVFVENGTVTAANSSSISDGAAALLLIEANRAQQLDLSPLARIVAHASHSQAAAWFTTAPVAAVQKVLAKAGWQSGEVDLFEVNEAFAVVAMAARDDLQIPEEKLNVQGGACALGHPVGASGARILISLINALRRRHLRRGVAAICIGGGEAVAMAVEIM